MATSNPNELEVKNWIAANKVCKLACDGLKPYAEETLKDLKLTILRRVCGNGQTCCYANSSAPCKNSQQIEKELMNLHRYFSTHSCKERGQNKNMKLCCNIWEIAKCYMPKTTTYAVLTKREDFDLNAVCSIYINCKHFRAKTADFDQKNPVTKGVDNKFTRLRDACNKIRHSGTQKLTTDNLDDLCKLVREALTDPCGLIRDDDAQRAMKTLMKFDQESHQANQTDTTSNVNQQAPNWCVCRNCQEMPTEVERRCCRLSPENCVSLSIDFEIAVDKGIQVFASKRCASGYDDEKRAETIRRSIYRKLAEKEHGPLGPRKRAALSSCCVWRVRGRFPSPSNKYIGFVATETLK